MIIQLIIFSALSFAQSSSSVSPSQKQSTSTLSTTNILDFETEVINGEKMTPDIFIQLSLDNSKLNDFRFNRKNFKENSRKAILGRPKYNER